MARINVELDEELINEGLKRTGFRTKRDLVQAALENYIRKQRLKDLLKYQGKVGISSSRSRFCYHCQHYKPNAF